MLDGSKDDAKKHGDQVSVVPGVRPELRLGRAVEVPKEEMAFVSGEALAEVLAPDQLNGGNLIDIYQKRLDDFRDNDLETFTLDVQYHLPNGDEVCEKVFTDSPFPTGTQRVCVSVTAVRAMHRAIAVLSRKVDNMTLTLRACRDHYYKELVHLRHGTHQDHEAYWFTPPKYEDTVTQELIHDRFEQLNERHQAEMVELNAIISQLKNELSLGSEERREEPEADRVRRMMRKMPMDQLLLMIKSQNDFRLDSFYSQMERLLQDRNGDDETREAGGEGYHIEFASPQEQPDPDFNINEFLSEAGSEAPSNAGSRRPSATFSRQVTPNGSSLLEVMQNASVEASPQEPTSAPDRRRTMFREEYTPNPIQKFTADPNHDGAFNVFRQQATEMTAKAAAWEMEAVRLKSQVQDLKKEILTSTAELTESQNLLAKLKKQARGAGKGSNAAAAAGDKFKRVIAMARENSQKSEADINHTPPSPVHKIHSVKESPVSKSDSVKSKDQEGSPKKGAGGGVSSPASAASRRKSLFKKSKTMEAKDKGGQASPKADGPKRRLALNMPTGATVTSHNKQDGSEADLVESTVSFKMGRKEVKLQEVKLQEVSDESASEASSEGGQQDAGEGGDIDIAEKGPGPSGGELPEANLPEVGAAEVASSEVFFSESAACRHS